MLVAKPLTLTRLASRCTKDILLFALTHSSNKLSSNSNQNESIAYRLLRAYDRAYDKFAAACFFGIFSLLGADYKRVD